MNLIFPVTFTISFFCPGILEAYAAYKIFPFRKYRGGLVAFIFMAFSAQFDLLFSGLMSLVIFFQGKLVFDLPYGNPVVLFLVIYLIISLLLWRFSSGLIALWFAGKLTERPVRRFLGVPEEDSQ